MIMEKNLHQNSTDQNETRAPQPVANAHILTALFYAETFFQSSLKQALTDYLPLTKELPHIGIFETIKYQLDVFSPGY